MADNPAGTTNQGNGKQGGLLNMARDASATGVRKGFDIVWNYLPFLGERWGKHTPESWEKGKSQAIPVTQEFKDYFEENRERLRILKIIERQWKLVEEGPYLFPYVGGSKLSNINYSIGEHNEPNKDATTITDLYRTLMHYRDINTALEEVKIFEGAGTLDIDEEAARAYTPDEIKEMTRVGGKRIAELEGQANLTDAQQKELEDLREGMEKLKGGLLSFPNLPVISISSKDLPFSLDGRKEEITAFGRTKMSAYTGPFTNVNHSLNLYSSVIGVKTEVRGQIAEVFSNINNVFEALRKIESKHKEKLEHEIVPLLKKAKALADDLSGQLRPDKNEIRFQHTYKIIKPFITVSIEEPVYEIVEDTNEVFVIQQKRDARGRLVIEKNLKTAFFNHQRNYYTDELSEVRQKIANITLGERDAAAEIRALNQTISALKKQAEELDKNSKTIPEVLDRWYGAVAFRIIKSLNDFVDEADLADAEKDKIKQKLAKDNFKKDVKDLIEKAGIQTKLKEFLQLGIIKSFNKFLAEVADAEKDKIKQKLAKDKFEKDVNIFIEYVEKKELKDSLQLGIIKFFNEFLAEVANTEKNKIKQKLAKTKFKEEVKDIIERIITSPAEKQEEIKTELKELLEDTLGNTFSRRLVSNIVKKLAEYSKQLNEAIEERKREVDNRKTPILAEIGKLEKGIDDKRQEIKKKKRLQIKEIQLDFYIHHRDLMPDHSHFRKADDEKDWGLDENGWPLEVEKVNNLTELRQVNAEDNGVWIVLLDKWWGEIKQNDWQMDIIRKKAGGNLVIKNKITRGIDVHGIRQVDEKFCLDMDPLDKMMFIENEWDSFRDDYRDGRYHPNSKTIMDYLIAGTKGITPIEPIHLQGRNRIDKYDKVNRIKFEGLYNLESTRNLVKGNVRPGISAHEIPEDERAVERFYELEIEKQPGGDYTNLSPSAEVHIDKVILKDQVRIANPFNPAFDRAALGTGFLHWGRMYYYETVDGINRWSENPYPHITTRGIAKYLIDIAIRRTFSFQEARKALMEFEWDYGIRHYDPPFITDPLGPADGPGGALAGAKRG